jgi:hypothetical protein
MNKDSDFGFVDFTNSNASLTNASLAKETNCLLAELDRALDHSNALRQIISRQEALLELESLTGSSHKTQTLRQEITQLEQQLYAGLNGPDVACEPSPYAT